MSALSRPGSRLCCNNTDKQEHGSCRKREEERRGKESGVQTHTGCDAISRFQESSTGLEAEGIKSHMTKVFLPLEGAWGCWRDYKTKRVKRKIWINRSFQPVSMEFMNFHLLHIMYNEKHESEAWLACSRARAKLLHFISYTRHSPVIGCHFLCMQLDEKAYSKCRRGAVGGNRECSHRVTESKTMGCSVSVCHDMRDQSTNREIPECGCLQFLWVDELFGDVESPGSPINLGDRGENSGREWTHLMVKGSLSALVPLKH